MGIGLSAALLATGAILYWAVTGEVEGLDVGAAGVILMIIGAAGLLWTLVVASSRRSRDAVVDRRVR